VEVGTMAIMTPVASLVIRRQSTPEQLAQVKPLDSEGKGGREGGGIEKARVDFRTKLEFFRIIFYGVCKILEIRDAKLLKFECEIGFCKIYEIRNFVRGREKYRRDDAIH
jgi:hypothetical protein